MKCPECQAQLPQQFALVVRSTTVVTCPHCSAPLKPTNESRSTYMISMFAGGLAVGSTVLLILVIRGLHTGIWLAIVILLAVLLGAIAAALTIQYERAETT